MHAFKWLSIALILFGCGQTSHVVPSATSASPNFDGLYFKAYGHVPGVSAIQITSGRIVFDPHKSEGSAVSGTFSQQALVATIEHPTQGTTTTTWGVVDGELWLNVLRLDPRLGEGVWRSVHGRSKHTIAGGETKRTGPVVDQRCDLACLFAKQAKQAGDHRLGETAQYERSLAEARSRRDKDKRWLPYRGPTSITWDTRRKQLTTLSAGGKPQVWRDVQPWLRKLGSLSGILPVHHGYPTGGDANLRFNNCGKVGTFGLLCPLGLFIGKTGQKAALPKAVGRGAFWQRQGDVVLTPWSIRLGPMGLIPSAAIRPRSGAWSGAHINVEPQDYRAQEPRTRLHTDGDFRYGTVPQMATLKIYPSSTSSKSSPSFAFVVGVPGSGHLNAPNAAGFRTHSFKPCYCEAGHMDLPGRLTWVPLVDGRLFLFHTSGGHHSQTLGRYLLSWHKASNDTNNPVRLKSVERTADCQ